MAKGDATEAPPAGRKQYGTRDEFYAKEVAPRWKEGASVGRIARELSISTSSVRRMLQAAGQKPPVQHKGTPANGGNSPSPSPRPRPGAIVGASDVDVALLKRDLDDERKARAADSELIRSMAKTVERLGKEPLKAEEHDGEIDVSCPNCGTSRRIAPRKAVASLTDFDEVLSAFKVPHENGKTPFDCPGCRPKIDATLKEFGLGLTPLDE